MANNTYTNATALAAAIELAKATDDSALIEKLERMHKTAIKPRTKSNVPTKTQRENAATADKIASMIEAGMIIGTDYVREHVQLFPNTAQKATGILNILVKRGVIERGDKVNGKQMFIVR